MPASCAGATEYEADDNLIIPVQDLASRYRFRPLVSNRLEGRQIDAHLESLFCQHGAPLFLKRDNGSPFNCQPVDEVLARFGVLPLNNPPYYPRYNGAQEKGIRDFKAARINGNKPRAENQKILPWRWKSPPTSTITYHGAASTAAPLAPSSPPPLDPPPAPNHFPVAAPPVRSDAWKNDERRSPPTHHPVAGHG